ncbi:CGNR zinc finger domain-containing protein [Amycolatopsis sp.]|uniref:CGNR zinc finger domain-containing protein n=1 Tax=Amycolatopsis sp. TaxID=37632 RepID=UPI002D7FADCB|nr:ABATE domain-containing protein [Amycolatopsis sp.]HET6711976.1 ABATE domain-containing protein [Amycolatopsis sp.]
MGDKQGFRFHGGRPSVDFTATVGMRWRDGGFERVPDPAALGRWFTEAGLTPEDPPCTAADLTAARELREAVYRLLRGGTAAADVATVNRWAAHPPPGTALHVTPAGLRARPVSPTVPALLGLIAADAVALLGGADAARVRECANPECSLLFLDTSRAGARRWCSMSACGSREKMQRYRSADR